MAKPKLTNKQVKAIWELFAKRVESPTEIQNRLHLPVCSSTVWQILKGQTYKHLKPGPKELTTGDFLLALFGRNWVTAGMLRAHPAFRYRHVCELQEFGIRLWKQNFVSQMTQGEENALCWKIAPKGMKYLRSGLGNLTKDFQIKIDTEQERIAVTANRAATEIETMAKAVVQRLMDEILPELYASTWPGHIDDFVNKANKRLQHLDLPARFIFEPKDHANPLKFIFLDKDILSPLEGQLADFVAKGGPWSHWKVTSPPVQQVSGAKCSDIVVDDIQVFQTAEGVKAPLPTVPLTLPCRKCGGPVEYDAEIRRKLDGSGDIVVKNTVTGKEGDSLEEVGPTPPWPRFRSLAADEELPPPAVTIKPEKNTVADLIGPPMYVLPDEGELDVVTFGTYGVPRVWGAVGLKQLVGTIHKVCNLGSKIDGFYEILEASPIENGVKLKMRRVKNEDPSVPR